ncbi:MAG: protein sorting system archaetidylserine synthase [Halobacteriales archaeon]|nr:protein sorting system archaetidylserine synthase [Halobacteriales archaeon]
MRPRFLGRLGAADIVTVCNGAIGFIAAALAVGDPQLAARLILLAAVGDGLDGVVARQFGSSSVGSNLDSLSDVAAFGVAPALVIHSVGRQAWGIDPLALTPMSIIGLLVPAAFLGMVVIRLGFYTAHQTDAPETIGVPSTLAATILATAVILEVFAPAILVGATALFTYLMIADITYPDLLARDSLLMGIVHGLAVVVPRAFGRAFPYALLTLALAYLTLGPRFYWRSEGKRS